MAYFNPEEETLDRDGLASLQRRKLGEMLRAVLPGNAFQQRRLGGIEFDPATDPIDRLPFTTRAELQQDQAENPPYGTNLTYPIEQYTRFHQTSGTTGVPLRWLDTTASWDWWKRCWMTIYRAAGITEHDRLLFPFSFGPFIGFWGAFDAAATYGCLCLPGGHMTTTMRLHFMMENDATAICCTPTYALRMGEVAVEEGIDLAASSVRALIVAGEPGGSIPATRERIETAWGARVFDHTGMTEIGPVGFECEEARGGVHLNESEFIVEVIDPRTGKAVSDGALGELVLTNLGRWGSPLFRYRSGDQVRITRDQCACGRWFARMDGGIIGRVDDMFVVRGNNVFPSAVEGVIRRYPEIAEYRMVVVNSGLLRDLRIDIEPAAEVDADRLAAAVRAAVGEELHFTPIVQCVDPGTLPRFELKARRLVREDEIDAPS
ncbi:MAG: AMP-binding protein [Planctomycetes bacterium]|nr:AMP-binding protein [Planctomycetota bacterium]